MHALRALSAWGAVTAPGAHCWGFPLNSCKCRAGSLTGFALSRVGALLAEQGVRIVVTDPGNAVIIDATAENQVCLPSPSRCWLTCNGWLGRI